MNLGEKTPQFEGRTNAEGLLSQSGPANQVPVQGAKVEIVEKSPEKLAEEKTRVVS